MFNLASDVQNSLKILLQPSEIAAPTLDATGFIPLV
jgi:hypothetical protein